MEEVLERYPYLFKNSSESFIEFCEKHGVLKYLTYDYYNEANDGSHAVENSSSRTWLKKGATDLKIENRHREIYPCHIDKNGSLEWRIDGILKNSQGYQYPCEINLVFGMLFHVTFSNSDNVFVILSSGHYFSKTTQQFKEIDDELYKSLNLDNSIKLVLPSIII